MVEKLVLHLELARAGNIEVFSVTTGRGIVHIGDDSDIKARLVERSIGPVIFMPSTDFPDFAEQTHDVKTESNCSGKHCISKQKSNTQHANIQTIRNNRKIENCILVRSRSIP